MAAVLLAAGTKGKRFSLPNSRIMIHQTSMQGLAGQATEIDIYAREILRMRETLNQLLAGATGQPVDRVARDVDRDYIMSAEQAMEYGMIDRVISSRELAPIQIPVAKVQTDWHIFWVMLQRDALPFQPVLSIAATLVNHGQRGG